MWLIHVAFQKCGFQYFFSLCGSIVVSSSDLRKKEVVPILVYFQFKRFHSLLLDQRYIIYYLRCIILFFLTSAMYEEWMIDILD